MKSLLITGNCPYNRYQEEYLQEQGIDAKILGLWGEHFPDYWDQALAEKPDIIHLQWPEAMTNIEDKNPQDIFDAYRSCFDRIKQAGIRLFWSHHNLLPHSRENVDTWSTIFQIFADYCDVACHHSSCGSALMQQTYDYGACEHVILRHGYFHKEQICQLDQASARKQLGLPDDANIYLAIGSIRPDKYIKELIECFEQRDPKKDILFIAGSIWHEYGSQMVDKAEHIENVIIKPGFMESADLSLYANAADAFLFMYGENHLTSGSPHLSQAHLRPQISLRYDYAEEVLADGSIYIDADEQRYHHLQLELDRLDKTKLQQQAQIIEQRRDDWHWNSIAELTKHAYEKALS